MASSGSYDFNVTRDQIINSALRKVGALAQGDSPKAEQTSEASMALNMIVKALRAEGVNLWAIKWEVLELTASDKVLGSDGNDYEAVRAHTSTTDNQPITGGQYSGYWKQLTTTTANAWAGATAYSGINEIALNAKYVGLDKAFLRDGSEDSPLTLITQQEYFDFGNKSTAGKPTMIYFQRGLTASNVFLYGFPDSTGYTVNAALVQKLDDFDASSDNPGLTEEWIRALTFLLAYELSYEYGTEGSLQNRLKAEAIEAKFLAKGLDEETGNLRVSPNLRN